MYLCRAAFTVVYFTHTVQKFEKKCVSVVNSGVVDPEKKYEKNESPLATLVEVCHCVSYFVVVPYLLLMIHFIVLLVL